MSTTRIEDIINAYNDGTQSWAETRRALITFDYVEPTWYRGNTPAEVYLHEAITELDTFDEVVEAYDRKRLTREEFYSVVTERERRRKTG